MKQQSKSRLFGIISILSIAVLVMYSDINKSMAALSSSDSLIRKPNPFISERDSSRLTKESFRIYIDSISKAKFDIVVSASDEIAWTIEIASGFRKTSSAKLRASVPIGVLPQAQQFISRFGNLERGLTTDTTEFLKVTDSTILVKTTFFSLETKPSIEILDVFEFKRDENGWYFDGYPDPDSAYPCMRPKSWRGQPVVCQKFRR